jgi:hypothetical protein
MMWWLTDAIGAADLDDRGLATRIRLSEILHRDDALELPEDARAQSEDVEIRGVTTEITVLDESRSGIRRAYLADEE